MHEIQREIGQIPFDYNYLLSRLNTYRFPRNKIGSLINQGEIIRVKKGLYTLSHGYGKGANRFLLANLIFGPSYISLESALAYWGLIPERVTMVTSVTTKRNKRFNTPAGTFTYRHVPAGCYAIGITRITTGTGNGTFLMATPEKALCDKVGTIRIRNVREAGDYIEQDLRADPEELEKLDHDRLRHISETYPGRSVPSLYKWYKRTF